MDSTKENLFTPDCIRTFSGLYMNVFDPTPEMICIEDIAHSLSMQCRFGGHLPRFYSVAQHSVLVSQALTSGLRLEGLLHDSSEAYLLDIPRPIKQRLSNYKEIEHNLMIAIADKFGFMMPLHERTKVTDDYMLKREWSSLMVKDGEHKPINPWSQELAKEQFMVQYNSLTPSPEDKQPEHGI